MVAFFRVLNWIRPDDHSLSAAGVDRVLRHYSCETIPPAFTSVSKRSRRSFVPNPVSASNEPEGANCSPAAAGGE